MRDVSELCGLLVSHSANGGDWATKDLELAVYRSLHQQSSPDSVRASEPEIVRQRVVLQTAFQNHWSWLPGWRSSPRSSTIAGHIVAERGGVHLTIPDHESAMRIDLNGLSSVRIPSLLPYRLPGWVSFGGSELPADGATARLYVHANCGDAESVARLATVVRKRFDEAGVEFLGKVIDGCASSDQSDSMVVEFPEHRLELVRRELVQALAAEAAPLIGKSTSWFLNPETDGLALALTPNLRRVSFGMCCSRVLAQLILRNAGAGEVSEVARVVSALFDRELDVEGKFDRQVLEDVYRKLVEENPYAQQD